MLAASDQFKDFLRTSHIRELSVHLYGATGPGLPDIDYGALQVVRGSLELDIASFVSTSFRGDVALDPYGTLSRRTEQMLAVENGYVVIQAGIQYPHDPDHPEFVKLATLRLTRFTPSASLASTSIEATDRTIMLRDYPVFDDEFNTGNYRAKLDAGWDWCAAVQDLVAEAIVGEVIVVDAGVTHGNLDPKTNMLHSERDSLIGQWAEAHGAWMRCDPDGVIHLSPRPETATTAVWEIQHGENGVLVENNEEYARDLVYNAVWVEWQQPDKPPPDNFLFYLSRDMDPGSRTYWNGPFGRRVKSVSDVPVSTLAEATALAETHLAEILGRYFTIDITCLTNPLLQLGDTIGVQAMDLPRHLRVIEGLTIPLGPDAVMTVRTRMANT